MTISETDHRTRIAVCGTGYWAEQVQLPVLGQVKSFELVGVHGRNPERVRELAQRHCVQAFPDFDGMLDDVEAISFAVPPEVQASLALRAVQSGKHVILEKPVATSLRDADLLVEAIERHGVSSIVYLPRLYSAPIGDLMRQAADMKADRGDAVFRSGALLPGSPYEGSLWRQDEFGTLWDIGPHVLSVLMSVFGPVRRVQAASSRRAFFDIELEHTDGRRSTSTLDLRDPTVSGFVKRYGFENGARRVESGELDHDRLGFFGRAVTSFVGRLQGRALGADARFGRDIVAVLEAARKSTLFAKPCIVELSERNIS